MRLVFLISNFLKILLAIFIFFIIYLIFYFPDDSKLKSLREANMQFQEEIKCLKEEIKLLEEKNKKLNKNLSVYEKLVRENLGLMKENEIAIDIEE